MRIPRNLSGTELIKLLEKIGYSVSRQQGSHVRLSTELNGQHHITIPLHNPMRIGTLNNVLKEIASHFEITKEELLKKLFN